MRNMAGTSHGTRSERVENVRTDTDTDTEPKAEAEAEYYKPHSSRSMALAPDVEGLARVIISIRPDWGWHATATAVAADDRPWRTVVLASINGAADPDIRHPNGLRYVNPGGKGSPTPTPPRYVGCTCPDCEAMRSRT